MPIQSDKVVPWQQVYILNWGDLEGAPVRLLSACSYLTIDSFILWVC
jgi:hypothetical protein